MRSPLRLLVRDAILLKFSGFFLEMELEFFVDFRLFAAALRQPNQLADEGSHHPS